MDGVGEVAGTGAAAAEAGDGVEELLVDLEGEAHAVEEALHRAAVLRGRVGPWGGKEERREGGRVE